MRMRTGRLKDKVALVTGGGSGIGRAIARSLAEEGATVCVAGRNLEKLRTAVAEFEALSDRGPGGRSPGVQALAVPMDLRREQEVIEGVQKVVETFGSIDILVNNSG